MEIMVYLDNAATSYPKPSKVYEEMDKCLREYCANPGRGGHSMSISSSRVVMEARETVCNFFNISNPMQLSFTKNATEALNIAIHGYLKQGDHVITTCMEHNSVIRPLKTLERNIGLEISIIKGNEFGEIDPKDFRRSLKKNTKLIVSTLSSNVNGIIMPVKEIGKIARESETAFLLDASQGAGSIKIDVCEMNIDMMAFPGHKGLLGPQGTGGLYVKEGLIVNSFMQGGTGSNSENFYQPDIMPDIFESGTLNTPGIVGLGCGIEFINRFGLHNLHLYKHLLVKRLFDGMKEIKGLKLYSFNNILKNSGIVAFNINDIDSTETSCLLDKKYDIASRAGLHCAPLAHKTLGTEQTGVVRLSVGCFNTIEEIDYTLDALRNLYDSIK